MRVINNKKTVRSRLYHKTRWHDRKGRLCIAIKRYHYRIYNEKHTEYSKAIVGIERPDSKRTTLNVFIYAKYIQNPTFIHVFIRRKHSRTITCPHPVRYVGSLRSCWIKLAQWRRNERVDRRERPDWLQNGFTSVLFASDISSWSGSRHVRRGKCESVVASRDFRPGTGNEVGTRNRSWLGSAFAFRLLRIRMAPEDIEAAFSYAVISGWVFVNSAIDLSRLKLSEWRCRMRRKWFCAIPDGFGFFYSCENPSNKNVFKGFSYNEKFAFFWMNLRFLMWFFFHMEIMQNRRIIIYIKVGNYNSVFF